MNFCNNRATSSSVVVGEEGVLYFEGIPFFCRCVLLSLLRSNQI